MERRWFRLILAVIITMALGANAYGEDNEYEMYTIEANDNYKKIAKKFQDKGYKDVTEESLKNLNNIEVEDLKIGQKIKIRKNISSISDSDSFEKKDDNPIITPNDSICHVGDTVKFNIKNTNLNNLIWKSSDDNKLEVINPNEGTFCAKDTGNVTISVWYDNKNLKEKIIVVTTELSFIWYLLVIGVICLAICILVRAKYWTKIKHKRKDIIWFGAVLVSLLLGALAWGSVRTVVFWCIGIAAGVAIAVLVIRAVVLRKKAEPKGRVEANPAKPKDDTDRNKQLIAQLNKDNERYREQIIQLKGEIDNYKKRIAELENKNREMLDENISLGEQLDAIGQDTKPTVNKGTAGAEKENKENNGIAPTEDFAGTKLYAESIVDGYMYRVKDAPNDDSVFELQQKGSNYATFTIYSEAERRVVANPSYLDGCDKQLLGRSSVKIIRQGEARLDDNGKWKVSTKLLVHIE